MTLPIDAVLPELRAVLADGLSAVLIAPPGAGKTTRVPLALLQEPWIAGQRIIMLEPRRLAARAAAEYMAQLLGETVGGTVGYRMRGESRVSERTRIEVVTEGLLTRMLVDDPTLDGVGALLFDEFHERSVHADAGLALALQSRALVHDDLRIVIMSATLEAAPVAALLQDAPIVRSEGRSFPVETHYLDSPVQGHSEPVVARTVRRAVGEHDGDVLVFLPGAAEINRVFHLLTELPAGVRVYRLHGSLPQAEQKDAIAPSPPGTRKVVLASAIAETSLTIAGVRVVIDSGWMRVPRFSPRTGMTRLATVRVTRASADQRRGRAGRTAPGVCYRLWTAGEDASLLPQRVPEILEADLAPLALDLAARGIADPRELAWLDPPPSGAYAQAVELLSALDAITSESGITMHGRGLARLPLHPRLGHMLLNADAAFDVACEVAALLEERDFVRGAGEMPDPDIALRLDVLHGRAHAVTGGIIERAGVERVRRTAKELARRTEGARASAHQRERIAISDAAAADAGTLLALAYPDRVGRARGARGSFVLRNGHGARVVAHSALAGAEWIVAAAAEGHGAESRVLLGAAIDGAMVLELFGDAIVRERVVAWDGGSAPVRAREVERLGAIVLRDVARNDATDDDTARAVRDALDTKGVNVLPWNDGARALRQRLAFMHAADAAWPAVDDAALVAAFDDWLAPFLAGIGGRVDRVDLGEALLSRIDWRQRAELDAQAPTHLEVPSGSRVPIDYADAHAPVLAARLQELFGWMETPRLAGGRVPLTIHLLSPARRPVQVTRDLASFWRTAYFDVRKDLRGQYPKHYWPDDPLTAEATRRVRPR